MYEISDIGRVRTIAHILYRKNGRRHTVKQTYLQPAEDGKGYLRVGLSINGKNTTHKVHRLVAECFIPNPENKPEVNHRFGKKWDNRATELEWATQSQNVQHAFDTGLSKPNYGPRTNTENFKRGAYNSATKLTLANVLSARLLRQSGMSFQKIADQFGVNKKTMMNAIKGQTWKII